MTQDGTWPGNHTDENWVGVTPEPPSLVGVPQPPSSEDSESCAVDGHEYEHHVDGMGDLLIVHCLRCERSWRCEET